LEFEVTYPFYKIDIPVKISLSESSERVDSLLNLDRIDFTIDFLKFYLLTDNFKQSFALSDY